MFRSKASVLGLLTRKLGVKVTSPYTSTYRASLKVIPCNWAYFLHFRGPEEGQVARAKVLTEDLLLVVRSEHAKAQAIVHQQQMELHQAQAQYAAYSAMAVGLLSPLPRSHLFCPSGIMVHELSFFVLFVHSPITFFPTRFESENWFVRLTTIVSLMLL